MTYVTYNELVERYCKKMADVLMAVVERHSDIKGEIIHFDKEERLQQALTALKESAVAA